MKSSNTFLDRDKVNMQQLLSHSYEKAYFMDYRADSDAPLAMIYQSGYLTIKGYDPRRKEFVLDFPNEEVRNGFMTLLANNYFEKRQPVRSLVLNIVDMLDDCRLEEMCEALTAFFSGIPYRANMQERAWSFESHYHYTLYLLFRLLSSHTTFTEKQNSRGRADLIVENDNYIYIFEFKLDGTAQEALDQIAVQGYAEPYAADPRKLIQIGVSISSSQRTITDWKERN